MSVEQAVKDIKQGKFVIVVDDENRENEGDFILAAQDVTPEKINFLLTQAKGMICVPMKKERLEELNLPLMVEKNEEHTKCMFTLSVDSKENVTTGISAHDRADAIKKLADPSSTAGTFVRPGHVHPLQAHPEGLAARDGHTEASIKLCELAGKEPVAIVCEILKQDGSMARLPDLEAVAEEQGFIIVTVQQVKEHNS